MPSLSFTPGPGGLDDACSWRRAAAELALCCAGSYAADEAARLRELVALLRRCPPGLSPGLALPEPVRVEALLAADAAATATLALFDGAGAGYLISRGGGGSHLASVILPGATDEVSAGGDTVALALIGALALGLAEPGVPAAPGAQVPVPGRRHYN